MEKLWKCWVLLLCIQVFFPTQPFAQTQTQLKIINSLKTRLQQSTLPDTAKVDDLNELAWLHRNFNYDTSLDYAKKAQQLAQKTGDQSRLATAYNRLGIIHKNKGEYPQALENYRKALDIEEKLQYNYGISRAYNQMGVVFIRQHKYQKALEYFQKSLKYLRKSKKYSQSKVAVKKMNMANCYTNMGETELAIQHYLEAISSFEVDQKSSRINLIGQCYLGLGGLYQQMNHIKKSRDYTLKALLIFEKNRNKRLLVKTYNQLGLLHYKVNSYKTALQYYYQNLHLREELGSTQNSQGVYNNMGLTYLKLAKEDSAQYFIQKSMKLSLKKKDSLILAQAYNSQGLLLTKQKKYDEAVESFTKALQLANKTGNKSSRKKSLEYLSNAYAKMGQYDKAFRYLDAYKNARDSLEANFHKAMDYKENYEKEKHQRKLLEKDQKIKSAELARLKEYSFRQTLANYFFGIGLLLSLIIVFAIIRNYQERRKVRQKQQRIDKLLHDQEFLALSKMLEGQEKERERVAQDLHDRLGGMLSVMKFLFTNLDQKAIWVNKEDKTSYDKVVSLLDDMMASIRGVSHNLSSTTLRQFGLIPKLNDLKSNIEATQNLKIDVIDIGFEEQRLPTKYEVQVYRMIQELLGNILKHAAAQEVEIQLYWKHEDANLHISVEDDGRGFDVAKAQERRGIGLAGVESRVKSLLGTYNIDSSLGKGTTVMIDIPVSTTLKEI